LRVRNGQVLQASLAGGDGIDQGHERCRQSSRMVRATALPSMIFAVGRSHYGGVYGNRGKQRGVTSNFASLARHFNPEHNES
jgi:hypothetical protein